MKAGSKAEEWGALGVVLLLAALCVLGAFLRAERAAAVFSSAPLGFVWIPTALFLFARLMRGRLWAGVPGAFVAGAGALFVLLGALYGSEAGHRLAGRLLGWHKFASGCTVLAQGEPTSRVADVKLERELGELPFALRLDGFQVTHHEPRVGAGAPAEGPAAEAPARVRNYEASIAVVRNGRRVRSDLVSVNHPLHYGGYHFSLYDYGDDGAYVVLLVKSDSGLTLVYAGFGLLLAGVFWACWAMPVWAFVRERRERDGG